MTLKNKKASEIEQELKIKLSRPDLEKVFKALSRGRKIEYSYLPRHYYDTPDLGLYRHGISLRVQYKPGKQVRAGKHEQTVKVELPRVTAVAKGALLRKECKDSIPTHMPDLRKVSDSQVNKIIRPFKKEKLSHLFTAEIERRSFLFEAGSGAKRGVAEVAFDVGQIVLAHNNRHFLFSEIEVELKAGNAQVIEQLHKKISRLARSARLQHLSKAEQGSRLYIRSAAAKKSSGYSATRI